MDPKARSEAPESTCVTQGQVSDADDPELEPSENGLWAADEVARPLGGLPRSKITGRHDAGSGANETEDGLTSAEEALRCGAEDMPTGAPEPSVEEVPVFDRADTLSKI
jgi:hypothetical protein